MLTQIASTTPDTNDLVDLDSPPSDLDPSISWMVDTEETGLMTPFGDLMKNTHYQVL